MRLGPGVPGLEPGLSFAGIDRWTMTIQRLPNKPSCRKRISRVLEQEMAAALSLRRLRLQVQPTYDATLFNTWPQLKLSFTRMLRRTVRRQ